VRLTFSGKIIATSPILQIVNQRVWLNSGQYSGFVKKFPALWTRPSKSGYLDQIANQKYLIPWYNFCCSWFGTYYGIYFLVDGLASFFCMDSCKSISTSAVSLSDSDSNSSLWSSGFDRPVTIDFQWHSCLFLTFI
jgi:hypothetical protein